MNENDIQKIVERVMKTVGELDEVCEVCDEMKVEASGRHVHLSEDDAISLFGTKELEKCKDLSQPGQYATTHRVTLVGSKGVLNNVVVLGPCRGKTQVEISMTDSRILGVKPVIRESGDLDGTPNIVLCVEDKSVVSKESVIVAKRHIHMQEKDASNLNVSDKDIVKVKVSGDRSLIFDDVLVRVSDNYRLSMHIDHDEANAVGLNKISTGKII